MLEQVVVKGFRSLRDFQLEIREGLNVLVGPNGAGKTNIILFFEFLRSMFSRNLAQAIGTAGGVAQVFAKKGKERFEDVIEASVSGHVVLDNIKYRYTYEFAIQFNKANQDVSFCRQRLQVTKSDGGQSAVYIDAIYESKAPEPVNKDRLKLEYSTDFKKASSWVIKEHQNYAKRGFFRQQPLLNLLFHSDRVVAAVSQDFAGRFVLNVVPSHVKKPEDITRKPAIESDGSGVSSTLFAIKRKRSFFDEQAYYHERPKPIQPNWQSVVDLIRIAVPSIESIEVVSDPFDNLLRCQITVGKGNRKSVVPL